MDTATRYTVMREDLSYVLAREYGDVNDSATVLAAIIDIGARPCTLVLNDDDSGTWLLDVDVTIPSHITLSVPMGVTVTGTANLTIQGGLLALRVDWFQSTGTLIWLNGAGVFQATQLQTGPAHLGVLTLDAPLAIGEGGTGARDAPQARINLGVVPGVTVQPYDATLAAIAALNGVANQMFYFTGPDAFGLFNTSIYSLALLGNTNSANWLAGLGCGDLAPLDTVSTLQIDDRAVTLPKLQTLQAARLIGRQAGSVGPAQEISLGSGLAMSTGGVLDLSGTAIAGTGVDNRVGIWSGVGSQTYDDMLVWNRTNKFLGIGTGTATERLHVFGNMMVSIRAFVHDGLYPKYIWIQDATGNRDYAGNPLYAISSGINYIAGQSRYNLNIDGTAHNYIGGNVGLGVLSPSYKLDVTGTGIRTSQIVVDDRAGEPVNAMNASISHVAGQNRWNLYILGTARNFFQGLTGFGMNNPSYQIDVIGTVRSQSFRVENQGGGAAQAYVGLNTFGTERWNLYMLGTASNVLFGPLGVATWPSGDTNYQLTVSKGIYADHLALTLPMRKRRGFQTVHCCTSRGPVQARQNWRIAATLAARRSDLPAVVQFATLESDALDAGVNTKMVACISTV